MVSSDRGSRASVNPGDHLDDRRVDVFWNSNRNVGRWFDEHITRLGKRGERRIEWDAFFLFGPDSEWEAGERPGLDRWGRTIHQSRDRLIEGLSRWEPDLVSP